MTLSLYDVINHIHCQGQCAEDPMVEGAACDPGDNWCEEGRYLKLGHGSMTGKNSHKLSNLTQMSNIHFILFFNALSISK